MWDLSKLGAKQAACCGVSEHAILELLGANNFDSQCLPRDSRLCRSL